ncbi:hypothetical protein C1645_877788 [Glomus cerebriforme]|uniref:Galactose oxidase n=1 Tax=Glomus cerebriforme TaxID=658196 RepID=A0A397STD5_9GLOM|nr:hypothetical protein C1645_877788 [Glomus cerebriforme]
MSKHSVICFILWIWLQILAVEVNCQMTPFKPSVTYGHTATLIENKLYILGGRDTNSNYVGKEFFYLDVSVPFNTQLLLWQDLSNINMVPPHSNAASFKGGANNNILFLCGGLSSDQTMAFVYTFDPQSMTWTIPGIAGINNIKKIGLTGVNHDGKVYLWGGYLDNYILNDMLVLDTINLNWGEGSLINVPTSRYAYGATLLPNNNIIYIGGTNASNIAYDEITSNIIQGNALTLSEVYLYDTINDNWSTKMTSGKIPSNRAGFSTVLGLDGQRVIIFGGYFINPGYLDTSLYVLDLTNYNWYVPKISGKIPKPRTWHKTNIIGKYMVVSFGHGHENSDESDILLLDISNNEEYIWTTIFDPSVPKPSSSSPLPSPSTSSSSQSSSSPLLPPTSNKSAIIGTAIGSLIGGIFLAVGSFFLYSWNKNKQKQRIIYGNNYNQEGEVIPTERNYNYRQEIIQIPSNENEISTNHEPIIVPTPVINRNYNYGSEVISTSNDERLSLQVFKDEMLQAMKQEISQDLKNEILQAVRQENSDNRRNNARQD